MTKSRAQSSKDIYFLWMTTLTCYTEMSKNNKNNKKLYTAECFNISYLNMKTETEKTTPFYYLLLQK